MRPARRHRSPLVRGIGLVETMVALALGLLVCGAAMSALIASGTSGRHAGALARMNENAAAATAVLREHLSLAGFSRPNAIDQRGRFVAVLPGAGLTGCDGGFADPRAASDQLRCAGASGADAAADAIAIVHEANARNALVSGTGLPLDCLGNGIDATQAAPPGPDAPVFHRADSRFFVSSVNGSSNRELYCKGAGAAAPQPLVEGIEDLQFTYGLATGTGLAWRRASEISSAEWADVTAVQFCVLAVSAEAVADLGASYTNCEGDRVTPRDRRIYRAFNTTVVLSNRVPAS